MSARNEGRSVRCIFCADSPEECQALCGDLSPLQRSRGGVFWVHEECARWASGVTALPPNPDEVRAQILEARNSPQATRLAELMNGGSRAVHARRTASDLVAQGARPRY